MGKHKKKQVKLFTAEQEEALYEVWAWCDEEDKSTEFMLAYMASEVGIDYDDAVYFVTNYGGKRRNDWYKKRRASIKQHVKNFSIESAYENYLNNVYEDTEHLSEVNDIIKDAFFAGAMSIITFNMTIADLKEEDGVREFNRIMNEVFTYFKNDLKEVTKDAGNSD